MDNFINRYLIPSLTLLSYIYNGWQKMKLVIVDCWATQFVYVLVTSQLVAWKLNRKGFDILICEEYRPNTSNGAIPAQEKALKMVSLMSNCSQRVFARMLLFMP